MVVFGVLNLKKTYANISEKIIDFLFGFLGITVLEILLTIILGPLIFYLAYNRHNLFFQHKEIYFIRNDSK